MGLTDDQLLVLNKTVAMVGLAVTVALFELLPLLIIRRGDSANFGRHGRLWLDHLLRAGGGVLIATTFLHLLPETRSGVEKLQASKDLPSDWHVPISELVMCIGFFMMYGLEELVHKFLMGRQGHETPKKLGGSHGELPHSDHHHHHHHAELEHNHQHSSGGPGGHVHVDTERPVRGILLVIAVSIHQVFEGMAVGLEKDVSAMWTLLGAIAAHKLVIAICVGAEIMSGGARILVQIVCLAVFATASPIGIGLGMFLTPPDDNVAYNVASALLQGIATGTLLFVVFFEILSKSQEKGFIRISQFLATFVGFFIMLILLLFVDG